MTRSLADLEAAFLAEADLEVDTDMIRTNVERGAATRRRRRSVAAGGGLVMLAAVVAVSIAVATGDQVLPTESGVDRVPLADQCTITALPLPAGLSGLDENIAGNLMVDGMDSTGRFVVASYDSAPDNVVFIVRWDNGIPTLLPIDDAGLVAHGINAQGTVVGGHRGELGYAWRYAEGGLTVLPMPDGAVSAAAFAINDRGDIAGEAVAPNGARAAVVWTADNQYAVRVLVAPGNAGVRGIAANGIMVGFADNGAGDESGRPYAWHPIGEGEFLPLPDGHEFGQGTQIRGEWVVGFAWHSTTGENGTQNPVAVRWDLRASTVITVDDWRDNPFVGVSASGVVGTETNVGATMIIDGQAYRLPRLAEDRGAGLMPVAVNDDATVIVGRQVGLLHKPVVLWRC